jgi:Beta propeller domain
MKNLTRPIRNFALSAASLTVSALITLVVISLLAACSGAPGDEAVAAPGAAIKTTRKSMQAFASEAELRAYFRQIAEKRKREARRAEGALNTQSSPLATDQAAAPLAKAGATKEDESVTNTQHAGVDEGGIVKLHGDQLVVLRRGRLFTVAIADGALRPIAAVDAFGPDIDPRYTWYDEMLVSEDTVVVIGYSYERGGTEVGLFNIDRAGNLKYRSTYHLKSNDYYSSRNYASRLIGNKLIFYTPLYLNPYADDPFAEFPAVRKWHKGATPQEFQRIVAATKIYRPEGQQSENATALHTVTVCDLANNDFKCDATGVLGPPGRVFYVSPESVYVWATDWSYYGQRSTERSMLYRMPLDASSPSALGVNGSPVDQFSFLESGDKHLNVLVRSNGSGDGMWAAENTAGDVALLRVSLNTFNDGTDSASSWDYHRLPKPRGYTFQNRFVGDYLLYGTGSGWGAPQNKNKANLFAVRYADGELDELTLNHGVDRIEALGANAIVVGTDGSNLHFSSIRLGDSAEVADEYVRKNASQGELRSHGFFYKPDGPDSGVLGLPISVPARSGYRHLFDESAAILFLRNDSLRFSDIGELGAQSEKAVDDRCRASCVDWYGNSRPLFFRGRIVALLGYELVEGTLKDGRIQETRRVNYAPGRTQLTRGE